MEIPRDLEGVVTADPETVSGQLRFVGTRVMVSILLDYVRTGHSLDDFLEGFPGVSREQAEAVLDWQDKNSRSVLGIDQAS